MKMAAVRILTVFAVVAMLVDLAIAATNYTVGASNGGWNLATDLQNWSSSQSFLVGDNLIFTYTVDHDVLEVSKQNYELCERSSPLQSFTGGNTVIPLSDPGSRYFICGTASHCSLGMKLEIITLSSSSSSSPSPSPSPMPTVASTPPPDSPQPPTPQVTVPTSSPFASPPAPPPDNLVQPPEYSPASSPPSPDFFLNPVLVPVSPPLSPPPPPSFGFRLNLSTGFSLMSVMLMVLIL